MMPKHIPATAKTADSSFMNKGRSYRIKGSEASPLSRQHLQVLANAAIEADEERVAHEGMTDRDLFQVRQTAEEHQVVQVQVVSGIDRKAQRRGQASGFGIGVERRACGGLSGFEGTRKGLRVQLHTLGAGGRRPPD